MLREKAMDFAYILNVESFSAIIGRFKVGHNFVFWTLNGQAKDVSDETYIEWKKI